MSSAVTPIHENVHGEPAKVDLAKFGMLTFLASEAMLFAGLISAYLILWISRGSAYEPEWLREENFTWPLLLTGVNTVFLLTSSYTLFRGEQAVVKNAPVGSRSRRCWARSSWAFSVMNGRTSFMRTSGSTRVGRTRRTSSR